MKVLEAWMQTPLPEAIGRALLHSLWEGALIACILAVALSFSRASLVRYGAACWGLLATFGGFAITLIREITQGTQRFPIPHPPLFPVWRVIDELSKASAPHVDLSAVTPWLTPFWLGGICLFSIRHLAGWIGLGHLRRRGICATPEAWKRSTTKLAAALHVSRPVVLLESCLAEMPMVLGHFRPVILMPLGLLTNMPGAQVEAILLHELAHIRRCDYLMNSLQRLVEGVLFYHPAVRWISHVVRTEREHCCDDMVVTLQGDAHEYALALTSLEGVRISGGHAALAANGGNLMKRIRRLLYPKRQHGAWRSLSATLMLLVTATAVLAAWQSQPTATEQANEQWLNQDVTYIISDEERAAFQKLTTDAERQMFVKQFWLRRDPTPDTPVNEFKEDHYRRIAYANKHFATASGQPGWQTDRGHIYIVYGPPDEIDSHPNDAHPLEMWGYRHVEGVGDDLSITFLIVAKTGDYRLAPGK